MTRSQVSDGTDSALLLDRASAVNSAVLFESAPFGMFFIDHSGRIADCNPVFVEMAGAPRERLIGFPLLQASRDPALLPYLQRALAGERVDFETTYTSTTGGKSGEYRFVFQPLVDHPAGLAVLCFVEDIFKRREAERARQALRLSEEMFSKAFRNSPDPMIISEISTGLIREINSGFTEYFGYTAEESIGRTTADLGLWVDLAQREQTVALMRLNGALHNHEVQFRTRDGEILTVLGTAVQLTIGDALYWLVQFRDITEHKRLQCELEREARTDFLTGLANRRHYLAMAEAELLRAQRYGGLLSMLMLDVDHFKTINDTYGHSTGDEALQVLARLCRKALREVDVIGRFGGEEFSILLPETGLERACEVAERIRRVIADERIVLADDPGRDTTLAITVSIGLTALRPGETDIDLLISRADQALYDAKRGGRNQVRVRD